MAPKTKICRLCLLTDHSKDWQEVDSTKLEMLKIVLPQSSVTISCTSIICNYCSESLQQSFNFKTVCLGSEDFLNAFLLNEDTELVLHEIVPKTVGTIKQEDELVCRLCLGYFESNLFTDLSRIDDDFFFSDMLENCLPEINIKSTRNPVICQNCTQSLQQQFNLISTFLDTNDKIKDYMSHMDIQNNNSEVDLQDVLQFISSLKQENNSYVKEEIKLEFSEDIKESEVHIKLEEEWSQEEENKDLFLEKTVTSTEFTTVKERIFKKQPQGIFACLLCPHETSSKSSMLLHVQIHLDTVQYKCDKCDFVTKWRSSLYHHSWLHDKEIKLHQCTICLYKTRYKKHLRRHSKCHENPKSTYRCRFCKFTSVNKSYFRLHNSTKHGNEVVSEQTIQTKSFSCDRCDFVTHKQCFLTKHRNKVHKRFICEHCGFQTSKIDHFKDHQLKHKDNSEVNMLQCAKCDFQTKYKHSLKAHLKHSHA